MDNYILQEVDGHIVRVYTNGKVIVESLGNGALELTSKAIEALTLKAQLTDNKRKG